MAVSRRLVAATGAGLFVVDAVAVIRAIVAGGPPGADAFGYGLAADVGDIGALKVIDDGAGAYVSVYHTAAGATPPHFDVYVATSTDLVSWTRHAKLKANANIPTIGRRADGSFVVAYASELSPSRLELRRYTNLANLLAGTQSDSVTLPQTLASSGGDEGTPNFYSVENPMDIGFHYGIGSTNDRNGRGTLTGWSGSGYTSWVTAAQASLNTAVLALGTFAVGDRDSLTYLGHQLVFVGAQTLTMPGPYGAFRTYYWDGAAAVLQAIATHGGSTESDVFTLSVLQSPTEPGRRVLFVTCFLHTTGAFPGEEGQCWWYRRLPV